MVTCQDIPDGRSDGECVMAMVLANSHQAVPDSKMDKTESFSSSSPVVFLLEKLLHRFRLNHTARLATVPRYQLPRTPAGVE
jgi:hypothetical protein